MKQEKLIKKISYRDVVIGIVGCVGFPLALS
jgi:hypothetical protein